MVAQQEQLRQNSGRAPKRILAGHAANEFPEFTRDGRPAGFPGPRFPTPIELKSLSVPLDHRLGLDDGQHGSPVGPEPGEPDPEDPVTLPQLGTFDGVLVDGNLLPQCKDLSGQTEPGYQEGWKL